MMRGEDHRTFGEKIYDGLEKVGETLYDTIIHKPDPSDLQLRDEMHFEKEKERAIRNGDIPYDQAANAGYPKERMNMEV